MESGTGRANQQRRVETHRYMTFGRFDPVERIFTFGRSGRTEPFDAPAWHLRPRSPI